MNEKGFVCRDDTMKEHELNLENKKLKKFSLCNIVHWSINQKRLQELLYIQAKLSLER